MMKDTTDMRSAALAYLNAWKNKDEKAIAARLHPKVRFAGPLSAHEGREAVLASFRALFPMLQTVTLHHLLVDGEQAVAAYDFVCTAPVGLVRMAELMLFEEGLIRSIEMYFDARPFVAQG
jgi:predicted ester cyclase